MKATASILITTTAALLLSVLAMGQGVGINTAGTNPHTSAVLDVASTTQGVLTPRMTEADAFLDGVAFAQRRGQSNQFPNAYD